MDFYYIISADLRAIFNESEVVLLNIRQYTDRRGNIAVYGRNGE